MDLQEGNMLKSVPERTESKHRKTEPDIEVNMAVSSTELEIPNSVKQVIEKITTAKLKREEKKRIEEADMLKSTTQGMESECRKTESKMEISTDIPNSESEVPSSLKLVLQKMNTAQLERAKRKGDMLKSAPQGTEGEHRETESEMEISVDISNSEIEVPSSLKLVLQKINTAQMERAKKEGNMLKSAPQGKESEQRKTEPTMEISTDIPDCELETPNSVKLVLQKINTAQLERAKRDLSEQLASIRDRANLALQHWKLGLELEDLKGAKMGTVDKTDEKKMRTVLLDKMTRFLESHITEEQELGFVLSWLAESRKTFLEEEEENDANKMEEDWTETFIEDMEVKVNKALESTQDGINKVYKLCSAFFDLDLGKDKKKGPLKDGQWKWWKESKVDGKTIMKIQELQPMTTEKILQKDSTGSKMASELNTILSDFSTDLPCSKVQSMALKYIGKGINNLSNALSLRSRELHEMESERKGVEYKGSKQQLQYEGLLVELHDGLKENNALRRQTAAAEEKCNAAFLENRKLEQRLFAMNNEIAEMKRVINTLKTAETSLTDSSPMPASAKPKEQPQQNKVKATIKTTEPEDEAGLQEASFSEKNSIEGIVPALLTTYITSEHHDTRTKTRETASSLEGFQKAVFHLLDSELKSYEEPSSEEPISAESFLKTREEQRLYSIFEKKLKEGFAKLASKLRKENMKQVSQVTPAKMDDRSKVPVETRATEGLPKLSKSTSVQKIKLSDVATQCSELVSSKRGSPHKDRQSLPNRKKVPAENIVLSEERQQKLVQVAFSKSPVSRVEISPIPQKSAPSTDNMEAKKMLGTETSRPCVINVEAQRINTKLLHEALKNGTISSTLCHQATDLITQTHNTAELRLANLFWKYIAVHLIQCVRKNLISQLAIAKQFEDGETIRNLYVLIERVDAYQKTVLQRWAAKQAMDDLVRNGHLTRMMCLYNQLRNDCKMHVLSPGMENKQPHYGIQMRLWPSVQQKVGSYTPVERHHLPLVLPTHRNMPGELGTLIGVGRKQTPYTMETWWSTDFVAESLRIAGKKPFVPVEPKFSPFPDIPKLLELDIVAARPRALTSIQQRIPQIPRQLVGSKEV